MSLRDAFGRNFRYDNSPEALSFFGALYTDMMDKFGSGRESMLCEKPELPCDPGIFAGWLAMNALAYGFRKGVAAAGCVMEVRSADGKAD